MYVVNYHYEDQLTMCEAHSGPVDSGNPTLAWLAIAKTQNLP